MSQINGLLKMMKDSKINDNITRDKYDDILFDAPDEVVRTFDTDLLFNKEEPKTQRPKTKIITVVSGKGGVGKSNITTNLAILYGQQGKKVLLLDADLGLANVNILMGLIPRFTLNDVVQGKKKLSDVIVPYNKNVDLIPGGTGFHQLVDLTLDQYNMIIKGLFDLPHYDIVLIDAGAGISQSVLSFVTSSDHIIIVTTPEPTALTDAYGMIKVMVAKASRNEASIIINMVEDEAQGLKIFQKLSSVCHKFLAFSLNSLGFISEDPDIKKAVHLQKPITVSFPKSKASTQLNQILFKLEYAQDPQSSKNSSLGNFFKKILNFYQ